MYEENEHRTMGRESPRAMLPTDDLGGQDFSEKVACEQGGEGGEEVNKDLGEEYSGPKEQQAPSPNI